MKSLLGRIFPLCGAVMLLLAVPVAAAEEKAVDERVAVDLSSGALLIQPRIGGEAVSVTVSCRDGSYISKEFEGVAAVSLPMADENGVALSGRCKYEARVHPVVDHEAMKRAEEAGDDASVELLSRIEQEQTVTVTGVFNVVGGAAVAIED